MSRILTVIFLLAALVSCKADKKVFVVDTGDGGGDEDTYVAVPFKNVPDVKDMVIYEANLRAFASGSSLKAVQSRLDAIKALGTNVLWLMPIYEQGVLKAVGSPYCIKSHTNVNAEYGTLQDLRTLVDEAHKRNMAVILDWVANHTSWDNAWITNKSWYTQDSNGNIIIPAGTNWTDVADLNYNSTDMRRAMIDALKYWINKANVDGFRCDAADFVPYDFWKQAIDEINQMPGRKVIWLAEGARTDHFAAGFQMNYGWDFYNKLKDVYAKGTSVAELFTTHQKEYANASAGKYMLRFTTNHDESAWDATPVQLFGGAQGSLSAFVITSFIGGVPLIYTTQEIGRYSTLPFFTATSIDWSINPDVYNQYKKIMEAYSSLPSVRTGSLASYSTTGVAIFTRKTDTETVLVVANTKSSGQTVSLPAEFQNVTATNMLTGSSTAMSSTVSLDAYGYYIFKK